MYLVVDKLSRNVLGECDTKVEAESLLLDFVGAHPPAAKTIVILGRDGAEHAVDRDTLREAYLSDPSETICA